MFRLINEIYDHLTGGGTYYGHQYRRILGYTEYAIYQFDIAGYYYNKPYDIASQKRIYIAGLRQQLTDEINSNNGDGLSPEDKTQLKTKLFKLVDRLPPLIVDHFSLASLQEFHYSHY
jgi:hypothetical protein